MTPEKEPDKLSELDTQRKKEQQINRENELFAQIKARYHELKAVEIY